MLLHWIWFSRCGISDWTKSKLLQHFADPEDIYHADSMAFQYIEGIGPSETAALKEKSLDEAQKILDDCRREGIRILTLRDAAYPKRLRHIPDPPVVLYYKGMLPDMDSVPAIGVVGTRKASAYGMQVARRMGYQIGSCGGIVVSGLAYGIDGMSMLGALESGATTVGVLGCGIDIVYPKSNRNLFQDTERYGCILSEFPPGTQPARWTFPKRNRIISGLSCGVLVVEAPEKSGALITARAALEQGRDVFVVPGNIDLPTCAGSNRMLREGAIPVSSGWDVLSEYAGVFGDKIRQAGIDFQMPVRQLTHTAEKDKTVANSGKNRAVTGKENIRNKENDKKVIDKAHSGPYSDVNDILPKLSQQERSVVLTLLDGERLVDDVIAETGLTTGKVLGILTMLELKKVIQRHPGKRISLRN